MFRGPLAKVNGNFHFFWMIIDSQTPENLSALLWVGLGVMSDAVLSVAASPPSGRSGRGSVTLQTGGGYYHPPSVSGLCDLAWPGWEWPFPAPSPLRHSVIASRPFG